MEVATQSMTLLASILRSDRNDLDLIQLTIDTLANVVTYDPSNDEGKLNETHSSNDPYLFYRTNNFTTGCHVTIYR